MAYATYHTRAIVCGSTDSYTSDRSYLLFTEAAGMVWANARSVRVEKSKQRYALQDFSILRVTLVKGKTGWKIGSVEALGNPFLSACSRSERALATAVTKQLRRYLHGEEPVRPVFHDVWSLFQIIVRSQEYDLSELEAVYTVRLLYQLGYVYPTADLRPIVAASDPVVALSYVTPATRTIMAQMTTTAETMSQL